MRMLKAVLACGLISGLLFSLASVFSSANQENSAMAADAPQDAKLIHNVYFSLKQSSPENRQIWSIAAKSI